MTGLTRQSHDVIMLRGLSESLKVGEPQPPFTRAACAAALDRLIAGEYPKQARNRPRTNAERNIWIAAACLYRERLIRVKIKRRYAAASEIAAECHAIDITAASIVRLCSTHGKAARKYLKAVEIGIRGNAKPARYDRENLDRWIEDRLRAEWQAAHALTLSMARK